MARSKALRSSSTLASQHLPGYAEITSGTVFLVQKDPGYLSITGDDRADFLQRQSTNDLRQASAGHIIVTVLTSPSARIIDVLHVMAEVEALRILTLPGRGHSTAGYLQGKIFFMDQVTVEDHSDAYAQVLLEGPQAGSLLQKIATDSQPEPGEYISIKLGDRDVMVLGRKGLTANSFLLLTRVDDLEALTTQLSQHDAVPLTYESHEVLRVEAGLSGPDGEWTLEYTPLETGLAEAISADKGCYTGQEVIARQITYDKITRKLVGLRSEADVSRGDSIWAESRPVGQVTSAVHSPRFGPIALAVIKRPYYDLGTIVQVGDKEDGVRAEISRIPFVDPEACEEA